MLTAREYFKMAYRAVRANGKRATSAPEFLVCPITIGAAAITAAYNRGPCELERRAWSVVTNMHLAAQINGFVSRDYHPVMHKRF